MSLAARVHSLSDLRRIARARLPRIAWEYLDSGTGAEDGLARTRDGLRAVTLTPRFLTEGAAPDLATALSGAAWSAPFGVAPVGMQSLMWPGAELALAAAARAAGVPYVLSTVAGETMEAAAKAAGASFWFQLYAPRDAAMRADLIARAKAAGAGALVVTVDVPAASRRERQKRAGVAMPPKLTPRLLADLALHPRWLAGMRRRGLPRFRVIEGYAPAHERDDMGVFINREFTTAVTPAVLADIRAQWSGPLWVKGVMHPADVEASLAAGADGIWVSNHGARQLDPVPASAEVLPGLVRAVAGRAEVVFDSGVRDGADVARALAMGARMAFLGRPFVWAAAAGPEGPPLALELLRAELANVMVQLGVGRPADLPERLG